MERRDTILVLAASLLVIGGAAFYANLNMQDTDTPNLENDTTDVSGDSTYHQKQHMGCQPGAVNKSGSCSVAFSGQNAEIFQASNLSAIETENTTMGGTRGYLARPADNGTYPSVVMIHEWWGLNENIRHMADVLAGQGYAVFAVDLYEGDVATNSGEAAQLSGEVRNNTQEAVDKMGNATEAMRSKDYTTSQVASLGWCFGGGQSLQLSLSDTELNSTIIYYGTLTTNQTKLESIDEPVLGIFGTEDQVVGQENIREFNSTLDAIGVENEIHMYEGAGHAFANPSGDSFRPNATRDAWNKTLNFLEENIKQ